MTPYYQDGAVTLYASDAIDALCELLDAWALPALLDGRKGPCYPCG